MKRLVVYTCVTGGYDSPARPSVLPDWADYVCFDGSLAPSGLDSTQRSRYHKLNPHVVLPEGYEYSLWIDGNIDILSDGFYEKLQQMMDSGVLYAGIHHPQRDDVFDESVRILMNDRESFGRLVRVTRFLKKEGMPRHWGLDETNVILRKHNASEVVRFDEFWWEMLSRWTSRDQMTQSYCLWKTGLRHEYILPEGLSAQNSPWFKYTRHGSIYVKDRTLKGRWRDAVRAAKVALYKIIL